MSNKKSNDDSGDKIPEEIKEKKELSPLKMLWSQVYGFNRGKAKHKLGKILTLIDAVIVNEQQNKSIKQMITNIFWEESPETKQMAEWFRYYQNVYHLEGNDCDEKQPIESEWARHSPCIEDVIRFPNE